MRHSPFPKEVCPIVPGAGWWVPASSVSPAVATAENSQEALDALGIIPASPTSNIPIVQHAMPCVCPTFPIPTGPPQLQVPLKGTFSPLAPSIRSWGVRSGRRSTIVGASHTKGAVDWVIAYETDGTPIYPNPERPDFFLRLKGNGMWIEKEPFDFPGITLKPLPSFRHPGIETIEIRGTSFPKTGASAIINNPQINEMLAKLGLRGNNVPLGIWYFAPMDGDPAPNIPKLCVVMKTLSDRRCENNLYAGLERIVLSEIGEEDAREVLAAISDVYRRYGNVPPNGENPTYERVHGLWKYGANEMIRKVMGTANPGDIEELKDEDVINGGFVPSEEVYATISERYRIGGDRPLQIIAKLFGRIGWEVGRCIAAVHRGGFDWGTYTDHTEDGILDNAHTNNIVVMPDELMDLGDGRYQLLMPTDFDMSFKKEQCVAVWQSPPVPDPGLVKVVFSVELGNMMRNIGGDMAALNGVARGVSKRDPDDRSPQMDLIWAFRDVACWEYLKAYKRPADPSYPGNDLTLPQARLFIADAMDRTIDIPS